ncbi:MAG: hypothetical protein ACFFCS_09295 [Candidatus Hodarchaeota archaeon]
MKKKKNAVSRATLNDAKKEFYRTYMWVMLVTSLGFAGIMGYMFIDSHVTPLISTAHYHFNVQYRAGNPQAMDEVVNNSLVPLLLMYQNHPTWKANIEFQGLMLDHMIDMDQRADSGNITLFNGINSTLKLLKGLTDRNQIQLVLVQYSSALALAYPYIDMHKSINYTRTRLEQLGFVNDTDYDAVSRVVLLQEGQFMPGSGRITQDFKHSNGDPMYDTFLTTRESLSYFNVHNKAPLYTHTIPGTHQEYMILPYWITSREGGAIHHVIWFQDGELVNAEGGHLWSEEGGYEYISGEFPYNDDMQKNHEARLLDLEQQGNQFYTLDMWVERLLDRGEVAPLDQHVPETHWAVLRYRSSFIWMGETREGGSLFDDSEINAHNYLAHQQLLATETLLNYTQSTIGPSLYNQLFDNMTQNWMRLAEAEVTDSTGLSPNEVEGQYAYNITEDAILDAKRIQKVLINATPSLNDTIYQDHGTIQILPSNLGTGNPVVVINGSINITDNGATSLSSISPLDVECVHNDSFSINSRTLYTPYDLNLNGTNYFSIKANFHRTNVTSITEKWSYIKFLGDFNTMSYAPALWENVTVQLDREDYNVDSVDYWLDWDDELLDNFEIHLALFNGMIYSHTGQYAIVKNCTTTHLSAKWNDDNVRFMQTITKSNLNPLGETWEYFVLMDVTAEEANAFANLVNTNAPITISEADLP